MKVTTVVLTSFILFGTVIAHAQDPNLNGKIKHVVVVIQENRTPDYLFGSQQNR